MIEAILFDFDDTLINYQVSERHGLTRALELCGVEVKEEYLQIYREENQRLWKLVEKGMMSTAELRVRRFEILLERTGIHIGISPKKLGELYLHHFAEIGEMEDGALQLLQWVREHPRLKTAILTNGFKDTQRRRFAVTQVEEFFDELFISGEMGVKKPEPEIFHMSLEKLNISDPQRVLIVGDNLVSDIMGGKKAGLKTCWYNPGGKNPEEYRQYIDYEISHLSELPGLPVLDSYETNKG
ncbi:MAG: YjjG family noncanonical pyrimidine nucleotidase [Sediminispirochaetaceae bacterium]